MRSHTLYIARLLLLWAFGAAAGLAGAIWLSQSLRFLDLVVNRGVSFFGFLQLTLLLFPTVLLVILPVATLWAVIHTYERLTTERELVVLRAVGVGPWGLAQPALALGALMTALGFALSLYAMPAGFRAFKDEQFTLRADVSRLLLQDGVFNQISDDLTVYVRARDGDGGLRGLFVHDSRAPGVEVTMIAESGVLKAGPLGPAFELGPGSRQSMSLADRSLQTLEFQSYTLDLSSVAEAAGPRHREPKERFLGELLRAPQTADERRYRNELIAEAHRRFVMPLNAMALAAIGLAAMVAGQFDRRRQWPRQLAGYGAGLAYLGASFGVGVLTVKNPSLAVVYYALPALACACSAAVLARDRLRLPRARRRAAGET